MKTLGSQNVFFFLTKEINQSDQNWCSLIKCALYRMTETKYFRDAFQDPLHELSGQPDITIDRLQSFFIC